MIELFYHPNNFASDVRNVINESELIVVGRHWSMMKRFLNTVTLLYTPLYNAFFIQKLWMTLDSGLEKDF